ARLTACHVRGEALQSRCEVGVFDVPERMPSLVLGKHTDGGNQLSETQLRAPDSNLAQLLQDKIQQIRCGHNASPTRRLVALGRFNLPMTSTSTVIPGSSFATRVA